MSGEPTTDAELAGLVSLVGAGPGDPDLITVAGLNALRRADVIIHDRLIPRELLAEASDGAELIDVGKRPDDVDPDAAQERINRLLIERAKRLGRDGRVVRLKGGDPFVFGRGGEEADALRAAGVPFEIIPGVSAAVAAPAFAGIPPTDRRYASSFTVVTGAEAENDAAPIDWSAIARSGGTIIVLMGGRALPAIRRRLIDGGLPANTPAAAVERASTPRQRSVVAPLGELPAAVERAGLRPPLTLAIGAVAELGERLAWFERRPLRGCKILITRPARQAASLAALLRAQGAEPIVAPSIELVDADPAPIQAAIARLRQGHYDDVVFTSVNGVERFVAQLRRDGGDARSFAGARIAAIGPATAAALERLGLRADLVPQTYTSDALLEALLAQPLSERRILLPRAAQGAPALSDGLRKAGAAVDDVALYDVRAAPADPAVVERLRNGGIDIVSFTAPSTVHGLIEQVGADALARVDLASIGPATSAAASAAGLTVHIEAAVHTMQGLVDAIVRARRPQDAQP